MLDDKVAIIYGAGSIGSAVARAFAAAGATVYLAGRTQATLDTPADEIRASGGDVHTGGVDARDPAAVRRSRRPGCGGRRAHRHLLQPHRARRRARHPADRHGRRGLRAPDRVDRAVDVLTSQATARHLRQGSGVILIFGGEGEPMRDYSLGGTLVAFHAQETIRRQLACELGPHGVRVITIVTGGIPETIGADVDPGIAQGIVDATMIGRAAT